MPPRAWRLRVADMLAAIDKIRGYTRDKAFEDFRSDHLTVDATIWNLIVVGEAARGVPVEVLRRYPDVAWLRMRGMRNVLIHQYFEIDIEIVWNTVQHDLPTLAPQLQEILTSS